MVKNKYDIFISYRRTSYDTANLIATKLRHAGYRVFFDVDTLTAGKFNEQLLEVIKECKDFVLVLPENALDRCVDENDWIRREVTCAIQNGRNIIPVMLDGFVWPKEMPQGMEELANYQAITAVGHEYFDMAMQRLQGFLKSKPRPSYRKWLVVAGIVVCGLIVLFGIAYGIRSHIVDVAGNEIGTKMSAAMNVMELIGEDYKDLKTYMDKFFKTIDMAKNDEDRGFAEKNLMLAIDTYAKNLKRYKEDYPAPVFDYNNFELYLLSDYGVTKSELSAFSAFYKQMMSDMDDLHEEIKTLIDSKDYSQYNKDVIATKVDCFGYPLAAMYYGYLGSLSMLPKSARTTHFEMAKKWKAFPNGTPLDLTQEEYEQFQMQEMSKYDEAIHNMLDEVTYEDYKLQQMEQQLNELEKKN